MLGGLRFRLSTKSRADYSFLRKQARGFQHLFGPRPHPVILRQHSPTHYARGINQELGWPRDVVTILALALVNQIVFRNRLKIRIRKKSKRVSGFLTKLTGHFGTVDANRDRANSDFVEPGQILLDAPQLGVA